jgi:P27 family predicted phage terminase small subunit
MSRIMASSHKTILPPKHIRMSAKDMPFFENVISEFARAEWTEHALEIASILARTLCDMEREQFELRKEGSIMSSEKGTPIANPRKTIVQMHAGTVLSLRKSLGLDVRSKNQVADIAKKKSGNLSNQVDIDDSLIATPMVN